MLTTQAAQAAKLSASLRQASSDENALRGNVGIVAAFGLLNKLERERSACALFSSESPLVCHLATAQREILRQHALQISNWKKTRVRRG